MLGDMSTPLTLTLQRRAHRLIDPSRHGPGEGPDSGLDEVDPRYLCQNLKTFPGRQNLQICKGTHSQCRTVRL